jgi:hypothetical protein
MDMFLQNQAKPVFPNLPYSISTGGDRVVVTCPQLSLSADGISEEEAVGKLNALVLYHINQW